MSRDTIVALASAGAKSVGHSARDRGDSQRDVFLAVMKDAKANWLAPTETEAFAAAISALIAIYPERRETLLAEARAIGDRNKVLMAMMSGVPVDLENWEPAPFPEDGFDLLALWREVD